MIFVNIQQRKRRPRAVYSCTEAFALPNDSNKQQETYADMTNRSATNDKAGMFCHTHRHLLLTLVLSRFESCEVSVHQTQSVNKRYQYV